MTVETPETDSLPQPHSQRANRTFCVLGVFVATMANTAVVFINIAFYHEASRLPAGTWIRPMGLAFSGGLISIVSLLLGAPLSWIGYFGCRKYDDVKGAALGLTGAILSMLPWPLTALFLFGIASILGLNVSE